MQTFLAHVHPRPDAARARLRAALAVTQRHLPRVGPEPEADLVDLPEMGAGWFTLSPNEDPARRFLTRTVGSELAVLAFGESYAERRRPLAEQVAAAWSEGGEAAAGELDGDYVALVFDRRRKELGVISDWAGKRSVRWVEDEGGLWLSAHDLPLVATGRVPVELDLVSAASTVVFDWSLEGRSLLHRVEVGHPSETLRWREGRLERRTRRALPAERLDPADDRGLDAVIDAAIADMQHDVAELARGADHVDADLTAGLDSRATLAVLRSIVEPARIVVWTAGEPHTGDVRTSARITRRTGLTHRMRETPEVDATAFERYLGLLAFVKNGDTNGKRALARYPGLSRRPPHLHGSGANVYKNYAYRGHATRSVARWSAARAEAHLTGKWDSRLRGAPWRDAEVATQLGARLREVLGGRLSTQSSSGADHLDLFAWWERMGRWSAMKNLFCWLHPTFSPFDSPRLARHMFRLPAPICQDFRLHRTLIARFLPEALYLPVNHERFVPFIGSSLRDRLGQLALAPTLLPHYARVATNAFTGRSSHLSHERVRAAKLAELLGQGLRDRLESADGIATALLEPAALTRLIDEHQTGRAVHDGVLGKLFCLDEAVRQFRRAAQEAGSASPPSC